jgi:cyclic pyranopterin phosphate synthase
VLTHINKENQPQMVNINQKEITIRNASASSIINIGTNVLLNLTSGDIQTKKGPVFATAIIAGTMAVKKTHELIPFCHPILVEDIKIEIKILDQTRLKVECTVSCSGKTGVEMEALTGVHVTCLTIHDMCKSMNSEITVEKIGLVSKTGGKKDFKKLNHELYALVLAGGKSERMGTDKALINYHGKAQAEYLMDSLAELGIKSFLSCRSEQVSQFNISNEQIITDRFLNFGPLGAILSAMSTYPNVAWLVIASDMPKLNMKHIQNLISERDTDFEACSYFNNERSQFEPLFSIYEPEIYPKMLQSLGEGKTCPQRILFNSNAKRLELETQDFLLNINTPTERELYEKSPC